MPGGVGRFASDHKLFRTACFKDYLDPEPPTFLMTLIRKSFFGTLKGRIFGVKVGL